jgi:hypothetical protein
LFKVTMILADAAQAVAGKLYILGGGWSHQWGLAPFAIGIKIEVPWDQATDAHKWRLELVNADGEAIEVETPEGLRPLIVDGEFTTGIAPGVKRGVPSDAVIALSFGPFALDPGRYAWRLTIDEMVDEDWHLAFTRLTDPPAGQAIGF